MEPSSTTYSTGTANIEFPGNSDFPFSPPLHVIITANFTVTGNQVDPEQLSSFIATTLKHVNTMFTSQNAKEWQEIATWALSRAIKEQKAPHGVVHVIPTDIIFTGVTSKDQRLVLALIGDTASWGDDLSDDLILIDEGDILIDKGHSDSAPRSIPDYPPPTPASSPGMAKGGDLPDFSVPDSVLPPRSENTDQMTVSGKQSFGQKDRQANETIQRADTVACSAYYPAEITPAHNEPLLVYISQDDPDTIGAIAKEVSSILGQRAIGGRIVRASSPLARGSELTIVPNIPGIVCKPRAQQIIWQEAIHRAQFQMQGNQLLPGTTIDGSVMILLGPLIFAEISIRLTVQSATAHTGDTALVSAKVVAYRNIFASYSHKDAEIVKRCRRTAEITGDTYLQDATHLHAGEIFDNKLKYLIAEADIFQLFWSTHAAHSKFVTDEWQYALSLKSIDSSFIRPIYWEDPMPSPPRELSPIHFQSVDPAILGIRRGWLSWFIKK